VVYFYSIFALLTRNSSLSKALSGRVYKRAFLKLVSAPMSGLEMITKHLNGPQKEAVETLDGPLLILAGAGSGKTRVLTHRMAHLIASGKVAADGILAVTFTNKAAREMEHRIFKLLLDLGVPVREQLWVSTFHSFCNRVLREHITMLDYKARFSIYDDGEQLSQVKKVMKALNINDKVHPAKTFRNRINSAKMLGLGPQNVAKSSSMFMDEMSIKVFELYESEMKKANSLDFGDLLIKVYDLFRMYPALLEQYQDKFRYILVDEYQDTNHIQYLLVKMLAEKTRNLCVVGDEDQSIYSWRGADISNILDFEKDFSEAKVIKLEENYRSSGNIVKAATQVIKNNTERKDKTLFTSNAEGDLITVREETNEYEEARWVVKKILSMVTDGDGSLNDYAIFYRTNAQSRVLEEQLRTLSVPYKLVGGTRFYERMEIKDIIGYMKLAMNPADDMAVKRVINVPARGIGKTTVEKLEEFSMTHKLSLLNAIDKACDERVFNAGTTSKLRNFATLIKDLENLSQEHPLLDFYQLVLERSGYLESLTREESVEAKARIENLEELSNAIMQFMKERPDASLQTFLEEMALVSDVDSLDEEQNSVTMMTMHISKGLEYPYVFIVGVEENLFPSGRSVDEEDEASLEEERRLAYVGMTRAREKLFLTFARARRVWGQEQFNPPSRFIKEIPEALVSFSTAMNMPKFVTKYQHSSSGQAAPNYKIKKNSFGQDFDSFPDYDEIDGGTGNDFQKGMKVRHPTFGAGSVFQTEGSGEEQKISVLFADQTIKKFVAKYARLERL
jgi:DNA helicase II / ATP-dependent DNA helicase PcrA